MQIELSENTLTYLHAVMTSALKKKMQQPYQENVARLVIAFTEITLQVQPPPAGNDDLLNQVEDWVAGKGKEPDPGLCFPRIVKFMLDENISLRLDGCKTHKSQAGRLSLVNPVYGRGYYGSFTEDGVFKPTKECTEKHLQQLRQVEERGLEAVKEIGMLTGNCCVCGRTLTAEDSINEGIGPICAGKFRHF